MSKENTRIHLTQEQMRQLARYERTFRDILPEDVLTAVTTTVDDEGCYVNVIHDTVTTDDYYMTLEDLTAALHNIQAANPDIGDLNKYWFNLLDDLEEEFHLDHARGEDEEDDPGTWLDGITNIMRDSRYFDWIWWQLQDVCWECDADVNELSDALDYDQIYAELERQALCKRLPVEEWPLTSKEMEDCIRPLKGNATIADGFSDRERALCRRFVDQLAAEDNITALYIKGYACYGGNALYDCDWPASRDCVTRLYELTDEPFYADTLGYIYYYGRCNGGVPEYEKAFYYYQVAAANGLFEGLYKLADMYWNGYACKKSPRTAYNLYSMVYNDCYRLYLSDPKGNMADAALRMGNVYAKGIHVEADPEEAYYYYTQAEYAARQRVGDSDFYGNSTVVMNIQRAMEEVKHDLPKDYFQSSIKYYRPFLLYSLANRRYRCELRCTQLEDTTWEMRAYRIKPAHGPEPECILVTVPEIGLCERTTVVTMTAVDVEEIWFAGDTTFRYDAIAWNDDEGRSEFYYDDALVAWIRCGGYRVDGRPTEEPYGSEYRLVSICFHSGGRSYDYLCDLDDVNVGDTVIVNGYDGETAVEVVAVRIVRESELALPVERYKKVVRKA